MVVNICGIPYTVEEVPTIDEGVEGIVLGRAIHSEAKILLREDLPKELEKATLWHEIVHALFVLIGRNDLSDDEVLVQTLSSELVRVRVIDDNIRR